MEKPRSMLDECGGRGKKGRGVGGDMSNYFWPYSSLLLFYFH